jgi:predicted glycosyltransferase
MNDAQSIRIGRADARPDCTDNSTTLRFLLYSHDSHGLGHLRRNLTIAKALLDRFHNASVIILTGSPCSTQFPLPANCDVVKIPAVGKDEVGRYVPRSLDLPLEDLIELRRQLILAAYRSFDPDVILVDHQPVGLLGEMLEVLEQARDAGKLLAFGCRDIVDAPAVVEKSWSVPACKLALEHFYDHVFIYGDQRVFDPVREYEPLRRIEEKVSVSGYVVNGSGHEPRKPQPGKKPRVLVTLGGGDDGTERIRNYLDALRLGPVGWTSHIVAGPLMPLQQVHAYKQEVKHSELREYVKISRFHGDIPGLMRQSNAIVSMAGYNSCMEILQSGTPAVLMPREQMRQEQSIRASRLAELGLAQHVPVGETKALRGAIEDALGSPRTTSASLNFDGLAAVCDVIGRQLGFEGSFSGGTAERNVVTACQ